MGCRLDEVGDLRRVQTSQAPVCQAQARSRNVGHERLEVGPGDELAGILILAAQAAGQQPPPARPEARIDARDAPAAVLEGELDLPGDDQPSARDVDHRMSEHVLAQQDLTGATLEAGQVQLRRGGPRRAGLERCDPRDRHEQVTAADPRLQATDQRQPVSEIEACDNVLDAPQARSCRVEQRASRQRREMNHVRHRPRMQRY